MKNSLHSRSCATDHSFTCSTGCFPSRLLEAIFLYGQDLCFFSHFTGKSLYINVINVSNVCRTLSMHINLCPWLTNKQLSVQSRELAWDCANLRIILSVQHLYVLFILSLSVLAISQDILACIVNVTQTNLEQIPRGRPECGLQSLRPPRTDHAVQRIWE